MRVGIALPNTNPYYHSLFVNTFFCMQRPGDAALLTPQGTGPLDSVRNELVQQALNLDCTHIFWCDTDQTYPPDTLVRLIAHNQPIVCAKVHRRHPPFDPLLKIDNPDKDDALNPYIDLEYSEWGLTDNLVEVDATGFGCNLMEIEVLKEMEKPWFHFTLYEKPVIGEDFYFWKKARDLGYKIFVDCTINIGHIGQAVIDKNTYKFYRDGNAGLG